MEIGFENHSHYQRAAGWAALGGAAMGTVAPQMALLPAAAAGGAFAIALWPGDRRRRVLAAIVCAAAGGLALVFPGALWPWPLCGALFAMVLAAARADAPSNSARALAAAFCAAAAVIAAYTLPAAALLFSQAVPRIVADAAAGGALCLWLALAAAPLHISIGADPVEAKLSALRPALNAELRALAERAAAARRGAAQELPAGARADLRGLLDSLALAALDLAARAAELGRSAPASLENDLKARTSQLAGSAAAALDSNNEPARQSYLRAAEALEGQLEHLGRVRRARERALARLHQEVANLERARFSLTLLHGTDNGVELDLLHERLQHGAVICESEEELAVPSGARAKC